MKSRTVSLVVVLASVALGDCTTWAVGHPIAEDPRQLRVRGVASRGSDKQLVVRSGSWRGQKGEQGRWRGRLEHDRGNGTFSGEVSVDGAQHLTTAKLDLRVRGTSVRGTLKDAKGAWVLRMTGEVSGEAMSGTYEARDGSRGSWSSP